MKFLGLKGNHQLFHALVVFYFVLFVGLLFTWNVFITGSVKNVYSNENGHVFILHAVSPPVRAVTQKQPTKLSFRKPVFTGWENCSVNHKVSFMSRPMTLVAEPVCSWLKTKSVNGNFTGYGENFAHLTSVIVNPERASGRRGGENITAVWNQKEQDEYIELKPGYFSVYCQGSLDYAFGEKNHLLQWKEATLCKPTRNISGMVKIKGLTIAVQRYEYVNLYHTMTDYYNAFLMMLIFNKSPDDTTILWVDSHPSGGLDQTWKTLFSNTIRAGHLRGPTVFEDMVWSIMGYDSPLNQHNRPFTPYLEQFREFFLTRHGVSPAKTLDCAHLNVLFIWRRDYIAHPRNPSGLVKRKIENEAELLETVRKVVPGHNVTGVQLDALPMRQQLELVANTDIFLGMHGAGLAHTLFLPKHGGLVEFYPTYWSPSNRHFRAMAMWRGLQYQTWQNRDSNKEIKYYTYIPPLTVLSMFLEVKNNICNDGIR
ncbi:beta-1,2-xylosyltransferase RCN11-like [Gigantopelta aegis]|uniref:beta-1,2-xylosyltransferase RCN11-like n=1 Tax=Gigantopelta aegis TaxID=1735272 RepID=UPI001B88D6C7|nr:beta-1,2-xylosyltransferase RCN11-like [Gigantopelta aegis]